MTMSPAMVEALKCARFGRASSKATLLALERRGLVYRIAERCDGRNGCFASITQKGRLILDAIFDLEHS